MRPSRDKLQTFLVVKDSRPVQARGRGTDRRVLHAGPGSLAEGQVASGDAGVSLRSRVLAAIVASGEGLGRVSCVSGLVAGLSLSMLLGGCSQEGINQETPEATIAAARELIEAGEAEKLPKLVYAETPELRKLYNTLGRLLGHGEELAIELQQRFPQEMGELAARAEAQAKEGKPTTLLGQIARQAQRSGAMSGNRRNRRQGPPSPEDRQAFNDALTRFFADPYAILRESEGRLTTVPMTDDMVALQWDKKMILPPVGMVMQKDEAGKWYFVLPTSMAGVRDFMPKTQEQFQIAGQLIAVLDKVVVDLRDEVRGGQLQTLEAVSRRAGEMTFLPAVLTFYAYTKLREDQRTQAGSAAQSNPSASPSASPEANPEASAAGGTPAASSGGGK